MTYLITIPWAAFQGSQIKGFLPQVGTLENIIIYKDDPLNMHLTLRDNYGNVVLHVTEDEMRKYYSGNRLCFHIRVPAKPLLQVANKRYELTLTEWMQTRSNLKVILIETRIDR